MYIVQVFEMELKTSLTVATFSLLCQNEYMYKYSNFHDNICILWCHVWKLLLNLLRKMQKNIGTFRLNIL